MSNHGRHIPPEIVEEILAHLPIKSLNRFSRVSKLWKSLISEPIFTKKRAAVRDIHRLTMSPRYGVPRCDLILAGVSSCPLSSISSDNAVEDPTPIIFPIEGRPLLCASCSDLWCVEVNNSLYLWNPSINTYKKIPNPSLRWDNYEFIYGLGYDSVSDDYKILRLQLRPKHDHKSELYSLRSDSWRTIDPQPLWRKYIPRQKCVSLGGILHLWTQEAIFSFDLATEKYGYVAPPPEKKRFEIITMTALRGKLCVLRERGFVAWVMEEYGIGKSWTKIYGFKYSDLIPHYGQGLDDNLLVPLYLFDNGELLFRVRTFGKKYALFMYKGEETRPWKMICGGISDGFVYDESLCSPLKFVELNVAKKQAVEEV